MRWIITALISIGIDGVNVVESAIITDIATARAGDYPVTGAITNGARD